MSDKNQDEIIDFERLGKESHPSLVREFVVFLLENKKWWLLPIVIMVGLVSVLVGLSSTGAAPFIYTLF
jgi:hypothetical protein